MLTSPELFISCELFRIDRHLDNFSIGCELFKNIEIQIPPVIHLAKVIELLLLFPLAQQDFLVKYFLWRYSIELLFNGLPLRFRQGIMCQIHDLRCELMLSHIFI